MAHQFGQNRQLDAQWLALTERQHRRGALADSLFSAFPRRLHIESAGSRDGHGAVATLRCELELCAPITLPKALRRGAPLWLVTTNISSIHRYLPSARTGRLFFVRGRLEILSAITSSLARVNRRSVDAGPRQTW